MIREERPLGATPDSPIEITPAKAAARWGKTARWWTARLRELAHAGIANKIGRSFFARPSRIEAWLAGELLPRRRDRGAA